MLFTVILTKNGTFFYQGTKFFSLPDKILFTFHYASTLSMTDFRRPAYSVIYIPLCFYFIAVVPPMSSAGSGSFTFHYASTLSHVSVLLISCILIYIPLCFYFIWVTGYDINDYDKFTFHYASTLSDLANRLTWTMIRDLHSTMLLLYRSLRTCECGDWNWIYIPLCFYFISRQHKMAVRYLQIYIPLCFYFILSLSEWMRTLLMNLHSTMLLLYRSRSGIRSKCNSWIYIPLCFYFIAPTSSAV